jgi:cytidine deaminase
MTGAKFVVAPCANCKKQLKELVAGHRLDVEIVGLHDVLSKALVFDKST